MEMMSTEEVAQNPSVHGTLVREERCRVLPPPANRPD